MSESTAASSILTQGYRTRLTSSASSLLKLFTFLSAATAALLVVLYIFVYQPSLRLSDLPWCLIFDAIVILGFIAVVATFLNHSTHGSLRPFSTHSQSLPLGLPLYSTHSYSHPMTHSLPSSLPPPSITRIGVLAEHTPLLPRAYSVSLYSPSLPLSKPHYSTFLSNASQCCVCLEDLHVAPSVSLKCAHCFHEHCIIKWLQLNRRCPVCRSVS